MSPNLAPMPSPMKVVLGSVDAPIDEYCVPKNPSWRDICVTGLEPALKNGLWKVLVARAQPVQHNGLTAEFKMIELNRYSASAMLSNLSMEWQFILRDGSGRPVMQLNEKTSSPSPIRVEDDLRQCVKALMQAVLERIGEGLAAFNARANQPGTDTAAVPPRGCIPGSTQECFGPGACRGGQACRPDGSGYEPCDCGTGTKM